MVAGQAAGGDADEIIAIEQPAEAGRDEVVSDGIDAGRFAIGIDEGGISDDDQPRSGGAEALVLLGAAFDGSGEDERVGGAGIRPLPTPPPHDPRPLLHRRSPKANSFQQFV